MIFAAVFCDRSSAFGRPVSRFVSDDPQLRQITVHAVLGRYRLEAARRRDRPRVRAAPAGRRARDRNFVPPLGSTMPILIAPAGPNG